MVVVARVQNSCRIRAEFRAAPRHLAAVRWSRRPAGRTKHTNNSSEPGGNMPNRRTGATSQHLRALELQLGIAEFAVFHMSTKLYGSPDCIQRGARCP